MSRLDHVKIVAAVQRCVSSSELRLPFAQHRSRVLRYGSRIVLSAILVLCFSSTSLIVRTSGESASWLRNSISAVSRFVQVRLHPTEVSVVPTYVRPTLLTGAPTNLIPTSAATTQIGLSWTAASGTIDHYEVERSLTATGSFSFLNNSFTTTFNDTGLTSGCIYRYRVRAVDGGGVPSAYSNIVFAMAVSFTDDPMAIGVTTIKVQHLTELRQDVNSLRQYAGLSSATWTDPILTGMTIKAIHFQELRDRLGEALTALNIVSSAYTDATLTGGTTIVKAIHLDELRQRVSRGVSSIAGGGPSFGDVANSRLDPANQTGGGGENPLSRNFNWNLPVVGLSGRAGLDLSLNLAYNSLVWTKSGSYISFDDDNGFPSPGFRLGFPVIQPLYYNPEAGRYAYLLISSDGSRMELRQVTTNSSLFESADSSHLLLDTTNLSSGDPSMLLRTTDGRQLTYKPKSGAYQCTEIKDTNGNYITINYNTSGRISDIHDTLNRVITFNYDSNGSLTSITQIWNQGLANQITHSWATFDYVNTTIQTNFSGLTVFGPANNSTIKTLSKVTLADGSHIDFTYSSWGQVLKLSSFAADNHLLNYRSYNLPQTAANPYTDCPRFTERHDFGENWNQNSSGVEQEAITTYAAPVADSWTMPDNSAQTGMRAQVTVPDLTSTKIYFIGTAGTASGWQRGLSALVNTYDSSGVLQRQAMTTWTQDDTTVSFPLNPRVLETNIYDPTGNRARVQMTYQQVTFANGTSCQLPRNTYEYAADASTILRSAQTDYNTSTAYTDRRIIGLVSERRVYEGDVNNAGTLAAKVGYFYDNDNGASSIQGTDAPVQHDNTNYSASFVTGRANLSSVRRYDVTNTAQFTTITSKYNTAGAVVLMADALNHTTQLSYTDSFSDGITRTTLAYPTTLTDADNYTSITSYNFDFGAVTYRRTPQPNTAQNLPGPEQTIAFDTLGRLQQVTNLINSAYTRYVYSTAGTRVDTYATIQDGLGEAHSFQITDGAGRVIGTATDHPGSVGGYSGQRFIYDVMGRTFKTSNATETSASGTPSQWTTAGDDASAGWIYTQQTYDWKGRPLVATNQDGTTKTASYAGCGCAGGEVITLTDEGTVQGGVTKTRQQRIYSDVLGRTTKTEVLDWDGTGPGGVGRRIYSATVNTYNARDQITLVRQYAGAEGSGTSVI
jgi:YD repeat-containing protein